MLYSSSSLSLDDTSCRCVKQSQISNCHSFVWTEHGYKYSNHPVQTLLPDPSVNAGKARRGKTRECVCRPVVWWAQAGLAAECVCSGGAGTTEAGVRIWNAQTIRLPTGYPRGSATVAMLTRPVIKEANLFNMSMLALLAAINKRRPRECCVCFFSAPGCFHLVCIFSVFAVW